MKILCVYAHPDDETVAAGGTFRLLSEAGHDIHLLLATSGQAGEVHESQQSALEQAGSIELLRLLELEQAVQILGITSYQVLHYQDGQLTNQDTWGQLALDIIDAIDIEQPDIIITFDHTGWYFHLDHIAVSIAVTRAMRQAKHQDTELVFSLLHPPGIKDKWDYVYANCLPATHQVNIHSVRDHKLAALSAHASQNISLIEHLEAGKMDVEYFQLVHDKGRFASLACVDPA